MIFLIIFLILFPLFFIPIIFPSKHFLTGVLNRIWANYVLKLSFIKYEIQYHFNIKNYTNYIFCANHTSYLDILSLALNEVNAIFVGKNDMENIPLFGYMYKKLHITLDRKNLKSRHDTIIKSMEAINEKKSLNIFPEGGIYTQNPPKMTSFKDGAFRLAIEKQVPIVPVSIPNNWIILPDGSWLITRKKMIVTFHEPIPTTGMKQKDRNTLKNKVFTVINNQIKNHHEN